MGRRNKNKELFHNLERTGKEMKPTSDWTDKDWNKLDKWLKGILQTETVTVTFTKKDGTERVMNCTTNPDIVPKVEVKEGATPRKVSETTMRVFDIDIKEWRSFTTKSIKHLSVTIGIGAEENDTV
jgi:hypothetical protein